MRLTSAPGWTEADNDFFFGAFAGEFYLCEAEILIMAQRGFDMLSRLAERFIRYRVVIIFVILVISGISAYYFNKIPRDMSVEAMVLEDDPDLIAQREFKEIFGNDEFVIVVAKVENIFTPKVMKDVQSLTEALSGVRHISEVTSYTNIEHIRGGEGEIIVEPLAPTIPKTQAEADKIREIALAESDYINNFYSADATTFAIIAMLENLPGEMNSTETRTAITKSIRDIVHGERYQDYDWKVAGVPVLKSDLATTQKRESRKFELYIFLLLTVSLYFIFRTIGGVFVTLLIIQGAIFMLMAGHYHSGIPLTMVSTILTPLMMVYGISSSVHFQTHYALRAGEGVLRKPAIIAAFAATFVPCLFNSATTAIGFGSNLVSAIKPVREFAVFASSGIMIAFILSFFLAPTVLSFFPTPGNAVKKMHTSGLRVHFLEWLIRLIEGHRKAILVVCLLLLGISIYGMTNIVVETRLLEHFKPESPIRSSYTFIEENISGISSMEIMIDTKVKDGMKDPTVIAKLEELADFIRAEEAVTNVTSLENVYKRINQALHGDDPKWRKIPDSKEMAAQLLLLYSMSGPESNLYDFVTRDYRHGRLSIRFQSMSSAEIGDLVDKIKEKTHEIFKMAISEKPVEVSATGAAVLYANMDRQLVWGQIKTFGLSLFLISIMMVLVAGEIGLGLVSLLPNLMPITITMGIMGFMGWPLDSTTAMVAPIALGMAVDSTIHFMVRFRREFIASRSYMQAQRETMRLIGRAMIGTSLPLSLGFFVLTTSEFMPVNIFGLLSGIVVILAMLFDLILTPIAIVLYKPTYDKTGLLDFFD